MFNFFKKKNNPNIEKIESGPINLVNQNVVISNEELTIDPGEYPTRLMAIIDSAIRKISDPLKEQTEPIKGYKVYFDSDSRLGLNLLMRRDGKLASALFFLESKSELEFNLDKILEWNYLDGVEATLKVSKEFAINFYCINYYSQKSNLANLIGSKIKVKLSGICINLEKFTSFTFNGMELDQSFCGYFPAEGIQDYGGIHIIGDILEIVELKCENSNLNGSVLKLKLINDSTVNFDLHVFVRFNMLKDNNFKVGDKVSAVIWLNGEITN